MVGAHVGSFEVTGALGRRQPDIRVSLVMYEENARKIRTVLTAINPRHAVDVIGLGTWDSMIAIGERLEKGYCIGTLADRSIDGEGQTRFPFLGAPAAFPRGPFRMAALVKRPIVLMVGIYRGGRRYDVFFEPLVDLTEAQRREEQVDEAMRRYVERLEHYCRMAPYNWFNFYDFWA